MITIYKYQDQKVGVLGLGKTGSSIAFSLLYGNTKVMAWDDNFKRITSGCDIIDLFCNSAITTGQLVVNNNDYIERIKDLKAMAVSPGIPHTHPVFAKAVEEGVPIVSDIELLQSTCPRADYIAISGTNGKSTTTALIAEILKTTKKEVEMGGNIGVPVLDLAPLDERGVYVLELSSFQLDLLCQHRFNVAILLNITPDHADRYKNFSEYKAAKAKIFDNQTCDDFAIISIDCQNTKELYNTIVSKNVQKVIPISTAIRVAGGVSVIEGTLYDDIDEMNVESFNLGHLVGLLGRHNAENIAAAYSASKLAGLAPSVIVDAIRKFRGLPHRMETVKAVGDLTFVNDSKATNADSAKQALDYCNDIYWIAGGLCKDGGIEQLSVLFGKLKHVFLIGASEEQFAQVLDKYDVTYTKAGNIQNALELIKRSSPQKGTVLLSPACSSLDQWKNYEERGDAFKEIVHRLWSQ
ncbi:UDP-N-acetylmuramoyl-L-alanine--D-glutamate ligase [Rickettsiales endosymbiont of Peranema trichophorum]|uniref:UDP-N-acetylmuramoyl-L-alanine--D-glutamate ligase n=1 Tax=Rickettsiales endosymbiont of Peranema trichophorum TaxID=2486577 RepID=UPI001023014F|nr:UDP-N-acetylmuramoyl-L-alanine--D-glutamate ligase [Rickettsiales endosymbiont of Peranema trichophorum]RZI47727.1 UDP-N-acetylmuramoyl-L-alanine--D-glutamate ligase [Rickettsiales endosymbiont of Peranema trichophorum]